MKNISDQIAKALAQANNGAVVVVINGGTTTPTDAPATTTSTTTLPAYDVEQNITVLSATKGRVAKVNALTALTNGFNYVLNLTSTRSGLFTHADKSNLGLLKKPSSPDDGKKYDYTSIANFAKRAEAEFESYLERFNNANDTDDNDSYNYDRRQVEEDYDLEDGELDDMSIREAEDLVGEETGALDEYLDDDAENTDAVYGTLVFYTNVPTAEAFKQYHEFLDNASENFRNALKSYAEVIIVAKPKTE